MKRNEQIDILKGVLIIFVVVGHLGWCQPITWFHMPLFFIISGYLYSKHQDKKKWRTEKFFRFMVPYFSYYVLVLVLSNTPISLYEFKRFLFGGRQLVAFFSVWWFPMCLLISLIFFDILVHKFSNSHVVIGLTLLLYLNAITFSILVHYINYDIIYQIPLNLDVCLLCVSYISLGYYAKGWIDRFLREWKQKRYIIMINIIGGIALSFLILYYLKLFNYEFNMKYSIYWDFILPMVFPCIFGILLLVFTKIIQNFYLGRVLGIVGRASMVIMYLHQLIIRKMSLVYDGDQWYYIFLKLIVSVLLGCLCKKLFTYYRITEFLFCSGNWKKNKLIK